MTWDQRVAVRYSAAYKVDMYKPGIQIDIPGFGRREITTVVSDYTGTHSRGGKLVEGVHERLMRLGELVDIHIISADSFGTAEQQLKGLPLTLELAAASGDTSPV